MYIPQNFGEHQSSEQIKSRNEEGRKSKEILVGSRSALQMGSDVDRIAQPDSTTPPGYEDGSLALIVKSEEQRSEGSESQLRSASTRVSPGLFPSYSAMDPKMQIVYPGGNEKESTIVTLKLVPEIYYHCISANSTMDAY